MDRREFLKVGGVLPMGAFGDVTAVKIDPMSRRRGYFEVSDATFGGGITELSKVFAFMEVVIVRAEHDWMTRNFRYSGYSPLFDEVPDGVPSPTYKIVSTVDSASRAVISVKVERQP